MERISQKTVWQRIQILIFSVFFLNSNVVLASKAINNKTVADIFEKAYVSRNNNMFTHYAMKIRDTLKANNDEYALSTTIETIPDKNIVFYSYFLHKSQGCNRYAFNIYMKCSDTIFINGKFWNQKNFNALLLEYNNHYRMIKNRNLDDGNLKFFFMLHFNTSEIDVFSPLMWKKMFDALHLIRQLRNQHNDSVSAKLFQKDFCKLNYSQKMEVVKKDIFFELITFYKF